jgi:hypothetical protein
MTLDIKEVIQAARAHFEELLPEYAGTASVRLEEIEREGKNNSNWAVTLSVPAPTSNDLVGARGPFGYNRIAKVIVVSGSNGQFVAMRQRAA